MFALRYKKLGGKIAYYRKLKNLTQVELATLVGISTSYLGEIERGTKQGAPISIYWKIAAALDVKFEKLDEE